MAVKKTKIDPSTQINLQGFIDSQSKVNIGILSSGPHEGGGIDILTLAAVHEFGSQSRNIPERSFLRKTQANFQREFLAFVSQNRTAIGQEILTKGVNHVLNKFGAWWVAKVNDTFEMQGPNWQELSEDYYERKAKKYPDPKILMSTGALRRSVTHEVADE